MMSWLFNMFSQKKINARAEAAPVETKPLCKKDGETIAGDNPIRCQEDDALGRVSAAKAFAQQVLSLDDSEGVVVGVLGPWGSGKTSFIKSLLNNYVIGLESRPPNPSFHRGLAHKVAPGQ